MESFDVSQENFLGDTNIKSEDEVRRYWMEEFYEKKSRLKLFFERVWYWFVVFLTGVLLIGIPVALTIFVVNFLPVLLFHMLVEEVILFGVLSTFCGSLATIGGYYLASVLFSYADKLNDRNNRDNEIDIEKRSPVQRVLAGFGCLSFGFATVAVPVCIITFYIDIAAIILLILVAACCSSDRNCFVYFNCSNNSFGGLGLWQLLTRTVQTMRSCWRIAVYGKSNVKTWEKDYDMLEKLHLQQLKKIFVINGNTNTDTFNASVRGDYKLWKNQHDKLLEKLGDNSKYVEHLKDQSRLIVIKYKIIPLIVKLADKTDKSADEVFAYENVLMSNFSIFDDNQRINKDNTTSEMYAPAPSAQNTSKPISNGLNNDKDEVKLLKKELLLVIETSNYLFGTFNQPNDVLKQMFEEYRNKCGYNRIQVNILDNKDMTKNINTFSVGNEIENDADDSYKLPTLEEIEQAKENKANVSLSDSIANLKSKFENNSSNNRYPSFDEFLENQNDNLINQNI